VVERSDRIGAKDHQLCFATVTSTSSKSDHRTLTSGAVFPKGSTAPDRVVGPRALDSGMYLSVFLPDEMEFTMGFDDKIKHSTDEAAGKVKEWVGDKTDNDKLEAEGKFDQASAKTKQAVEAVKDDLKDKLDDARDRASNKAGDLSDKVADKADEVKDRSEG